MNGSTQHIGEIAERVGLSLRTVRYYEEQGLITPQGRTEGGFRLYTDEHVERLELIMHMKPLGFSVLEMKELLDARDALKSVDSSKGDFEKAMSRFSGFVDAASERVGELRGTLATAEAFAEQLRREVENPSALRE